MKSKINIHFIYILLSAFFWGIIGLFIRSLEGSVSQMGMVFGRSFFTAIILGVFILFKDKKLFKIKLIDLPLFIGAGILSIVLFNFSYFKTMSLTSLSVAGVLLYTAPFFVVFFSAVLFKEKINLKKAIACVIAFVGCLFVSGVFDSGSKITTLAIVFGLLSGLGYALYTIFGRLLIDKKYNTFTITFYVFLFSTIGCVPFDDIVSTVTTTFTSLKVLIIMLLMAFFSTVIPFIFYTKGLLGVEASVAPIIATLEPVVATVVGVIVYNEALTLSGVLGILFVLGSVVILNLKDRKNENKS